MTNASSTLLSYAPSTDPSPVGISTDQVDAPARVNFSIAARTAPVYGNQIVIAVPVGDDDASLYTGTPTGSANTGKWAVTTQLIKGAQLWTEAPEDQDYAVFTFDCVSPNDYLIDYNLVFGVLGQVDSVVGAATIAIQETTGTTSDPQSFTQKQTTVDIDKAWPQFALKNFTAYAPSAPTVPATDFANGAPVAFSWESNGTWFEVFMSAQSAPVYAGSASTFTLGAGVSRDTTFVLAASVTGSPGQDTPQGGYEPVVLYDALTITVSNPVLTPTSANIAGTLNVIGQTTLGAASAGALSAASADVSGLVTGGSLESGSTLKVSGGTTLAGTTAASLTVNGATTLGTTTTGGLTVNGGAAVGQLNVGGRLYANTKPVAMLTGGTLLAQGSGMGWAIQQAGVQALTDGFAVAYVTTPGDNGKSSFGYGQIYTIGTWFQALGGTVGSFGSGWSYQMDANSNAITIPIPAGTYWYYAGYNWDGAQLGAPIAIYWFPMGGNTSAGAETYRRLTADDAAEAGAPPRPPTPNPGAFLAEREGAASEFVKQLDEALGKGLGDDLKAQLSKLLLRV